MLNWAVRNHVSLVVFSFALGTSGIGHAASTCDLLFGKEAGPQGQFLGVLKAYRDNARSHSYYIVGARPGVDLTQRDAELRPQDEMGYTPDLLQQFPNTLNALGFRTVSRNGHGLEGADWSHPEGPTPGQLFFEKLLVYPGAQGHINSRISEQAIVARKTNALAIENHIIYRERPATELETAAYLGRGWVPVALEGSAHFQTLHRDAWGYLLIPEPVFFQIQQNLGNLEYVKLQLRTQAARRWIEGAQLKYFREIRSASSEMVAEIISAKKEGRAPNSEKLQSLFQQMVRLESVGGTTFPRVTTGKDILEKILALHEERLFALDPKERALIQEKIEALVTRDVDFSEAVRLMGTLN